jgi:hypothetical protein
MYRLTLPIAEDLDFNVMTRRVKSLDEDSRVLEKRLAPGLDHSETLANLFDFVTGDETHATATTRRLQHNREADALSFFGSRLFILDEPFSPRYDRNVGLLGQFSGSMLNPERLDALGRGPDPYDTSLACQSRKMCVLRQKSIARYYRIHPPLFRYSQNRVFICVSGCVAARQQNCLVSIANMLRRCICFRVDSDSLDVQFLRCLANADLRCVTSACGTSEPFGNLHNRRTAISPRLAISNVFNFSILFK